MWRACCRCGRRRATAAGPVGKEWGLLLLLLRVCSDRGRGCDGCVTAKPLCTPLQFLLLLQGGTLHQSHKRPKRLLLSHVQQQHRSNEAHTLHITNLVIICSIRTQHIVQCLLPRPLAVHEEDMVREGAVQIPHYGAVSVYLYMLL